MRIELQSKFIQYLNDRKNDRAGFTLVELLVVIIIIGILAASALPSFLNQNAKAKQAEARQIVGAIGRHQTARRVEKAAFTSIFDVLAIGSLAGSGSVSITTNYSYILGSGIDSATIVAQSKNTTLKSYTGGNNRYTNTASESTIASVSCESLQPGTTTVVGPSFTVVAGINTSSCGSSFTQLGT